MNRYQWKWKPDPDYHRLINALFRNGDPRRVPFLELFADPEVIAAFLCESLPYTFNQTANKQQIEASLDQKIRFWHTLGYDAIWQGPGLDFPGIMSLKSRDTACLTRHTREWVNEKAGAITSWEDFENYPWPHPQDTDYYPLEFMARNLPDGMGILASTSGVYEPVSWLMGFETFSVCLYEQVELVEAMFSRVRDIIIPIAHSLVDMDRVVGLWMGDDLGFKTGTLISPQHLRRYVFPIQREIAEIAHTHGKPFILHSCGNLTAIMDNLITDVGIDAKHSFEDVIEPVEMFCGHYGHRIGVIGGVDIDIMARGTEKQVRQRTRQILESCATGCGYILGSGNSIANYIPLENFLAMVDEGWHFNLINH